MEIRVLRYFLTVVREESITKASEVLHITQPTLSRQLAQMEEDIGVKLFDRGTSLSPKLRTINSLSSIERITFDVCEADKPVCSDIALAVNLSPPIQQSAIASFNDTPYCSIKLASSSERALKSSLMTHIDFIFSIHYFK